jgi:hypothetical protein
MRTLDLVHLCSLPSVLRDEMLSKRSDLLHAIKGGLRLELFDSLGCLPKCLKGALCSGEIAFQNWTMLTK